MQVIADAVAALAWGIVSVLFVPTVLLLVLRRFMPFLGNPLWQMYQRALLWCFVTPFRLVRVLAQEATRRRRGRG
jgi:hypothetical protein